VSGSYYGWAMGDEAVISDETIDELCEALFHANVGQVSNLPYRVGSPAQTNAAPSNAGQAKVSGAGKGGQAKVTV